MAFTIVGRDRGRFVSVTRAHPAGAALLADLWLRSGFTDVQIGSGTRCFDLAGFRARCDSTTPNLRRRETIEMTGSPSEGSELG